MILGITLLVFLVLQAAPGDQASSALGDGASEEAKQQYRQENGLNDPLFLQYFRFLGKLLQFDLGVTTPPAKSVASMIGSAFPLTLQLTFLGVLIAIVGLFNVYRWMPIPIGVIGIVYLFYGRLLMLRETRMANATINAEMDFTWQLARELAPKGVAGRYNKKGRIKGDDGHKVSKTLGGE